MNAVRSSLQARKGRARVAALAVLGVLALSACGNQGWGTRCGDYLGMSVSDRESVIQKGLGFHATRKLMQQMLDEAFALCDTQGVANRGGGTIGDGLGP